jgi:hypothetical protein
MMRKSVLCASQQICLDDKINKKGKRGARSLNGGRRNAYRFLAGKPDTSTKLAINKFRWKVIFKWILRKEDRSFGLNSFGLE